MTKSFKQYDEEFKVVIVGSASVGKSALIVRFVDDKFKDDLLATIGVDFRFRTMNVQGLKVKLQIWDTAGQQSFRNIISAYYKGSDAIILVYDLTEPSTFKDINQFWLREVEENKEEGCQLMLIGNKCDLQANLKRPTPQSIQELKQKLKTELYFETSAKTSNSVEAAFVQLATTLLKKKNRSRDAVKKGVTLKGTFRQQGEQEPRTNKKCCG